MTDSNLTDLSPVEISRWIDLYGQMYGHDNIHYEPETGIMYVRTDPLINTIELHFTLDLTETE